MSFIFNTYNNIINKYDNINNTYNNINNTYNIINVFLTTVNFDLYYIDSNPKFYSRLLVLSFQIELLKNKTYLRGKI